MTRILIAAGGTGGHVYPALAVASVLRDRGHDVAFTGGDRIEARVVPEAGFVLHRLPSRGLPRTDRGVTGRAKVAVRALGVASVSSVALVRAWRLVGRLRPDVVLAMGGHTSLAPSLAAGMRRLRLVLHEQNARLVGAHRIAARFASVIALSLPLEDPRAIPSRVKVVETGNPVRNQIAELRDDRVRAAKRAAGLSVFGLDDGRPIVLAFGGSLGSGAINGALPACAAAVGDAQIVHVTGRDHVHAVERAWHGTGADVRVVAYVDAMEEAYAVADVVVSRSGATTVAELAVAGLPAIVVPLPNAPSGAQPANARVLAGRDAATIVEEGDAFADRLAAALHVLLSDADRRRAMGRAAASLGHPDASQLLADLVTGVG